MAVKIVQSAASANPSATELLLSQLDLAGVTQQLVANGQHRTEYDDATEIQETWANLTSWTNYGSGLVVSGGKAYGVGGTSSGAYRAMAIGDTQRARIVDTLVLPGAGGTGRGDYLGFDVNATPGTGFAGIGISGSSPYDAAVFFGSEWSATTAHLGSALTAGTYLRTITMDETHFSFTLRALTGTLAGQEWSTSVLRSTKPSGKSIQLVVESSTDSTGTSGFGKGPLGVKVGASGSMRTRTVEGQGPSAVYTAGSGYGSSASGDRWRISLPANYDSRRPAPLCIFLHQAATGWEKSPVSDVRLRPVEQALSAAGFILASLQDGAAYAGSGTVFTGDRYGNQASMDNHIELYRYIRDHYSIGPVCLLGASLGGLTGLNLIALSKIPNIVAMYAIDGSADLSKFATIGGGAYAQYAYTAYGAASDGSDFQSKIVGYNPLARFGNAYRGVYLRWLASSGDTTVPIAEHGQLVVNLISPYSSEATLYQPNSLGHLDASHYIPSDITAFFQRAMQLA